MRVEELERRIQWVLGLVKEGEFLKVARELPIIAIYIYDHETELARESCANRAKSDQIAQAAQDERPSKKAS